MLPLPPLLAPLAAVLVAVLFARSGAARWLADRPLLVLAAGGVVGVAYRLTGLSGAPPEALREAARLGLAFLAFVAAQQCRPSRLPSVSRPALRLSLLALPLIGVGTAAAVFALLPSLGLRSAALIGAVFVLGGGVFDEREAMKAPLAAATKRTVRLDAALGLLTAVTIAALVEAAITPPLPNDRLWDTPAFGLFAGGAVGGTIGLLAGRFLRPQDAAVPSAPLVAFGLAYAACVLLGFDGVIGGVACGLLYSEEAGMLGPVRSRVFGAGLAWVAPLALFAGGAVLPPVLASANVLMGLAAAIVLLVLMPLARGAALGEEGVAPEERRFLARFGAAPGAGAALFLLALLASPALGTQGEALAVGTIGLIGGVCLGQVSAKPLVLRQVRAAARARKKRYAA